MWPYPSDRFAEALTASHDIATRFEIWRPGDFQPAFSSDQVWASSDPSFTPSSTPIFASTPLRIIDGSVTYDKQQDQRSQFSLKLVDPDEIMIPKHPDDLLTPWGNEIRIFRGIAYPDGTREYALLGTFHISKVVIEEASGTPTITLTGYDRSWKIHRNVVLYLWPSTGAIGPPATGQIGQIVNKSYANFIQVALADRWGAIEFDADVDVWTLRQNDPPIYESTGAIIDGGGISQAMTGFSFSEGTDMWSQCRQVAQVCGCDLFFTRDGVCKFYRDPAFSVFTAYLDPIPVWQFTEGSTAMFDQITRTLDDSAAYNAVLVYGDSETANATAPLASSTDPGYYLSDAATLPIPVTDNDPTSPTFYDGSYGHVPHVITNNLITGIKQVNDFALLQLILDLGAEEAVSIPSLAVNPCLDVDDVIQIERQRIGIDNNIYIIQQHVIPLTATNMGSITTRLRRALT